MVVQELEHLVSSWGAELAHESDPDSDVWRDRVGRLSDHFESISLHHEAEAAPLVPAVFLLCKQLICHDSDGQAEPVLLEAALGVAHAAKACVGAQAVRNLCSAAAVASFRASLQALARLQQLSKGGAPAERRAAAPLLLELPPVLARIIDHLEVSVQLVAWIRVAAEVIEESSSGGAFAATSRGWALRFCARCVERCSAQLSPGGADFPAWEVLSEVLRFHERNLRDDPSADASWAADCDIWRRALEGAARAVSREYPEQAREFLLLATCTGSPMPEALERMLDKA